MGKPQHTKANALMVSMTRHNFPVPHKPQNRLDYFSFLQRLCAAARTFLEDPALLLVEGVVMGKHVDWLEGFVRREKGEAVQDHKAWKTDFRRDSDDI